MFGNNRVELVVDRLLLPLQHRHQLAPVGRRRLGVGRDQALADPQRVGGQERSPEAGRPVEGPRSCGARLGHGPSRLDQQRDEEHLHLVDVDRGADRRGHGQVLQPDHPDAVRRRHLVEQLDLLVRVRVVDQHPSAEHVDRVVDAGVQQGLVDGVPGHQVLGLGGEGLRLRSVLGGLGLGQQRADPWSAPSPGARPTRPGPGSRPSIGWTAARQVDGGGSVMVIDGNRSILASSRRAEDRVSGPPAPVVSSRPQRSPRPVADGGQPSLPNSLGGALQLVPPALRRQTGPSTAAELLDREIGGEGRGPLVDPQSHVQQVAGLPARAPQVCGVGEHPAPEQLVGAVENRLVDRPELVIGPGPAAPRRRPVASPPRSIGRGVVGPARSPSTTGVAVRSALPVEAPGRRSCPTVRGGRTARRTRRPGRTNAAASVPGEFSSSAWRRVVGGCCVPCRTP